MKNTTAILTALVLAFSQGAQASLLRSAAVITEANDQHIPLLPPAGEAAARTDAFSCRPTCVVRS